MIDSIWWIRMILRILCLYVVFDYYTYLFFSFLLKMTIKTKYLISPEVQPRVLHVKWHNKVGYRSVVSQNDITFFLKSKTIIMYSWL